MILDNLRITIREIADDVDISFGSCQAIFTDDLDTKRGEDCSNTTSHVDIAQEVLTKFNEYPDLHKNDITGDESWVYV